MSENLGTALEPLEAYLRELDHRIDLQQSKVQSEQETLKTMQTECTNIDESLKRMRLGNRKSRTAKPKTMAGRDVIMPVVCQILEARGATDLPTLRSLVLAQLKAKGLISRSNGVLRSFTKWLTETVKIEEVESGVYGLVQADVPEVA